MTALSPARVRWSSRGTAAVLGGLTLLLVAAGALLTGLTHDLSASADGATIATPVPFAAVGVVVARRQPRNPIGWLLIAAAMSVAFSTVTALYPVLDYRVW